MAIGPCQAASARTRVLLVLDEIQKVPGWSEVTKRLWDEELASGRQGPPAAAGFVCVAGATRPYREPGGTVLPASLHALVMARMPGGVRVDAGPVALFWRLPGAAALAEEEGVWKRYVNDSLIETVLARNVLQMQPITKPTLLRHLFALAAHFPAQMFSYNKMLGQLTDAGNTVTLAHYLRVSEIRVLASGLELFSKGQARKREGARQTGAVEQRPGQRDGPQNLRAGLRGRRMVGEVGGKRRRRASVERVAARPGASPTGVMPPRKWTSLSARARKIRRRSEKRPRRQGQRESPRFASVTPRPRPGWSARPASTWKNSSPIRPPSGFVAAESLLRRRRRGCR